jgi:hypothetical protein
VDWQTPLTWLTIGLAAVYLVMRGRRAWRGTKTGCGGSCGCSKDARSKEQPTLIAPEQLTLRSRPERAKD